MPVEWSIDNEKGIARIEFREPVGLDECLTMVRNVAAVTAVLGDCSLVLDGRELTRVPDFELVVKVTQLALEVRNRQHPGHYALLARPGTAAYGKSRQISAVLNTLGLTADYFDNEQDALNWCANHNPRLRDSR